MEISPDQATQHTIQNLFSALAAGFHVYISIHQGMQVEYVSPNTPLLPKHGTAQINTQKQKQKLVFTQAFRHLNWRLCAASQARENTGDFTVEDL